MSANTRLFSGVEQKTLTKNSKSGYKLKVPHIAYISAEENNAYYRLKSPVFIRTDLR